MRRVFAFARPILYEDDGLHEEDDDDIKEIFPDTANIIGRQSFFREHIPKLARYYGYDRSRMKKNSETTINREAMKKNEGLWSRMKKDWDPTMTISEVKKTEGL